MKFSRKKGEEKLYEQWIKHSELAPEAIPQDESPGDVPVGRGKNERGLPVLYILLAVSMLMLCTGLVLLLVQSC